MRKPAIALIVLAVVGCAAWYALQRALPSGELPPNAARLEGALALPGLLGLAAVDLKGLVSLQRRVGGDSAQPIAAPGEESWLARLASAGVDPYEDIDYVLAAAYARDPGVGIVFAALGSFAPLELERALRESPEFDVAEDRAQDERVLRVTMRDRTTCEESGPWLLHALPDRILIGDPDSLGRVLASQALRSDAAQEELAKFREFRAGKLVTLAAFIQRDLPSDLGNPMVAMAAGAAISKLGGFRSLYLGAGIQVLPPALDLVSMLEARDPAVASEAAALWTDALEASRDELSADLPTVAALLERLEISADDHELWIETSVSHEIAGKLSKLPGELAATIFGGISKGLAQGVPGGSPAEALAEQLDPNPLRIARELPVETLDGYDSSQALAGDVDQAIGPFGFRLSSLALPDDSSTGIEIVIDAVGTGLSNLGRRGKRAQLAVTSVRGRSGDELLAEELCGEDRNDLPVVLTNQGSPGVFAASKRIRLQPGAQPSEIAFIEGHVKLRFPVRTEVVRLTAPSVGDSAARGGAQLAVTQVSGSSIGWSLQGEADRLLLLRALNATEEPLLERSSMQMASVFGGGGASGSTDFAGTIAHLEAVFAVEEEEWEFPFALTAMQPGSSREQTGGEKAEFVAYPIARIRSQFAQATRDLTAAASGAAAQAKAGPFVVSLEGLWSFRGLMPRFQVRAPAIPNLEQSLSGMELSLREIRLRDGTIHTAPQGAAVGWSQLVSLSKPWGEKGLEGSVSFETGAPGDSDDVQELHGSLVLRMPRRVSTLSLADVKLGAQLQAPGFSAVVAELGRNRFVLRSSEGGERMLAVSAYNAAGAMLWMTSAEVERNEAVWRSEFQVQGVPHRIDVTIAEDLETAEYPFAMQLAQAN